MVLRRPPTSSPSARPRRLALVVLLAAAPLVCRPAPTAAADVSADAVKATFLYKFVPFVDWPPTTLTTPDAPVVICIVGDDPFGPNLERAVAAQRLGARPITVRRMGVARAHAGCHVMYIAGSDAQSVGQALRIVHGEPMLTVTDGAEPKGIIDFAIIGGRVRFRIDEQSAADNGLQLRSTLLSLAVSVDRGRRGQ